MEIRRLITAIALSLVVLMLWSHISAKLWPRSERYEATTRPAGDTSPTQPAPVQSRNALPQTSQRFLAAAIDDHGEQIVTLGNGATGSGYMTAVQLVDRGAAVRQAKLVEFAEEVGKPEQGYRLLTPVQWAGQTSDSLATERVLISMPDEQKHFINLEHIRWRQPSDQTDPNTAKFYVDILDTDNDDRPVLRIWKIYTLTTNEYDLHLELTVENLIDQPLDVILRQRGPMGLRLEDPRLYSYRKTFSGFKRSGDDDYVAVHTAQRSEVLKQDNLSVRLGAVDEQVVWAGQANKYFAALLAPVDQTAEQISYVAATAHWLDAEQLEEDLTTAWVTKPIKLTTQSPRASLRFDLYLGPKSTMIFNNDDRYRTRYYEGTIEYSWCTMQSLANIMVKLLRALYVVSRNYGLAIILMVIIVRGLMHPITKSSQINMFRMQRDMKRIQPKMQAIKEKYKNNRDGQNKAIMDLYKQEGISPANQILGCLPMMLQMPIWVALWTALNNTFELRHQPFIPWWINDLASPDAIIRFSRSFDVPLVGGMMGPVHSFNLLPLLLGVSMLLQQKATPQPPSADPAQAKQQKVMFYFMSVFLTLIFYNAPSGLTLYIFTSNVLGFLESRRIRKHLNEEQSKPKPTSKKAKPSWWDRLSKRMEKIAQQYEASQKKTGQRKRKSGQ